MIKCNRMKIKQLICLFFFVSAFGGFGQIFKFSEFSFANNGGNGNPPDPLAAGQYNGSPDWIEIYNNTTNANPQTLSGWYLSDDRNNLRKWQIPTAIIGGQPIKLDSHEVCVVYLCGHDKAIANAAGTNSLTIGIDLHANFSCNQTKPGTKVYLTQNNGQVRDSIDVYRYKNKPGHSWGREFRQIYPTWQIPGTWRLYATPSPGLPNPYNLNPLVTPQWYIDYCPMPKVDLQPGFYGGGLPTINVTDTAVSSTGNFGWYTYGGYSNVEIYGTNDCSAPVSTNAQAQLIASAGTTGTPLTGSFAVPNAQNSPAVIVRIMTRDASVPKRYLDGFEFYGAYIDDSLGSGHKIPVTCVCVDTTKLFMQATPKDSMPMIIHHFDKLDKSAFKNQGQGHVGKIDFFNPIGPGTQKKMWQFVFRSEDEYGYNYTNTSQLFKDQSLGYSDRTDFPELLFRSAAEENFLFPGAPAPLTQFLPAHMRDFYNHTMGLRHNLRYDGSHYTPTYMVMNGFPRGIYYIKETIDSLYTKHYYDHANAAILVNSLAGTQAIVSGTGTPSASTRWNWFYSWAMNPTTNVHIPTLYYRISDSLDFNSFNDYMVYNFLSVNTDFVKRYAMWWKGLPNDTTDKRETKWRFGLTNTDFTWGYDFLNSASLGNVTATNEPCDYLSAYSLYWPSTGNAAPNSQYPLIPLWYKLMANDTFKSEFVNRYSDLLNTALSCDSLTDHLKYVRSVITASDMAGHVWYNMGDANGVCVGCDSVSYWNDQLDSMRIFMTQRCSLVNEALVNCFPELSGPYNLCIDVEPVNSGYVQFNSLQLKNFIWNGKYFDSVIQVIKGIPYQNYVFDHWETNFTMNPGTTSDSATFYITADGCIKAVFKLRPAYETVGDPMLPTGFSPNNDGNNDILNVYGIADASSYELEVYNRWGERVFFSSDKTQGWDGRYNGTDAPVGVYAYRYNITIKGKNYQAKGNVTLVR
jgi:gliding motility-associated-like protein